MLINFSALCCKHLNAFSQGSDHSSDTDLNV